MDEKLEKYPKTELFRVIDTIQVPHPYTIGDKHVAHASDHFSGMLGREAIVSLEKKKGRGMCEARTKTDGRTERCTLRYEEHETALLVEVEDVDITLPEINRLLTEYLLSIKELCEKDGFAGFAFIRKGE